VTVTESPAEQDFMTMDELVADIAWHASMLDRECVTAQRAIFDRIGLHGFPETKELSRDDLFHLETMVNTDYTTALIGLAVAIGPVIRKRLDEMGDLLPVIRQGYDVSEMPGDASETFMRNIFAAAGIEDRFDWGGWKGQA
jgi:hypothetical protein